MKITQVISHYVPATRFGGPQQVAHGLGKALTRMGHEVSVCTTNMMDEHKDLQVAVNEQTDVDGVRVTYSPTCCSRYWAFSPGLWRSAKQEIADADFALVHFHYQFANWVGAHLARRNRKPYAIFAHGSFKHEAIERSGRWKKQLYLNVAEGKNLQAANRIYFNAREEQEQSRFANSGCVLPNGIDPDEFQDLPQRGAFRVKYGWSDDDIVFLFLGRIDYVGKGLDNLVPAFAKLVDEYRNVKLVFAGPDERGGQDKLEQALDEHNLKDCTQITGMLEGNDKLAAFVDADAFLLPSRSEGMSIALLEALYLGLPVLVTNQVGLWQTIERTGAGIVVQTDTDLLPALKDLCNQQCRDRMRNSAVDEIRANFTWDAIAKTLLDDLGQLS